MAGIQDPKQCEACVHAKCCEDRYNVKNALDDIRRENNLNKDYFAFQIDCAHYLNNVLVWNAIKAYQNQNKQEEK